MKRLLILFLLCSFFSGFAQDEGQRRAGDGKGREKIKAAHAAYITQRLDLTSAEVENFWPVYKEWAEKRKAIRQQFHAAKQSGSDEKSLIALDLKIKQQMLDLEKEYTLRFQEIISAEKVMELRQAEIDFRKLILHQIQRRRK